MIRVVIADDHPVVRDGLRLTIERSRKDIVVVGEATDGIELLRTVKTIPADVYIVDVTMPKRNGIEAARELLRKRPSARIIMLSLHDTQALVEEAFRVGAHGYLTKDTATRNIVDAVTEVHAGRFYLSPSIAHFFVRAGRQAGRSSTSGAGASARLTAQEKKVLQLIAEGHSTKEIAGILGLAVNTVHAHRNRIMAALGIHRQAHLIRYAIREGIAKL